MLWHDLECGAYEDDLPLWRELAARAGGPVLDLGAGTGRVALDLARAGHEVVALDLDAALPRGAARPGGRAAGHDGAGRRARVRPRPPLPADPRADADGAAPRRARGPRALPRDGRRAPRARAACSPARWPTRWTPSTPSTTMPPPPDRTEVDGVVYASAPVAVRDRGDRGGDRARPGDRRAGRRPHREHRRHRARPPRRRRARGRGGRARPARRAAGPHPRERRVRRIDGGDAPCLSATCASARSIRT